MKVTQGEDGKTFTIQGMDVFFFTLAVAFGTLISAGVLKILGVI